MMFVGAVWRVPVADLLSYLQHSVAALLLKMLLS